MNTSIRGFTLIEIILYIALTSILLTFTTGFVVQIWDGTNNIDQNSKQQAEYIIALERMDRELQRASAIVSAQSIFENDSSKIVFTNKDTNGKDALELSTTGVLQITRADGSTDILTTTEVPLEVFWVEIKSLPKRPPVFFIRMIPRNYSIPFESVIASHSLIAL